jgi:peroxiredoxin
VVVGVNTSEHRGEDPFRMAKAFQEQHKLTYPVLVDADGKVGEAFGVQGLPANVIIDREGKVHAIVTGFDPVEIDKALRELGAK